MKKLMIAIPSNIGRAVLPAAFSFSLFEAIQNIPEGYLWEIHYFSGLRIDAQRNNMIFHARRLGMDAIIMLDDDMVFPKDVFPKLIKHWENGCGVISAIYYNKGYPYHQFLMPDNEWVLVHEKKLYKTKMLATGCILIDMKVFDQIKKPYFLVRMDLDGNLTGTEDCYFAFNCGINGVDCWVDTDIVCQHIMEIQIPKFWSDPNLHFRGMMDFKEYKGLGNVEKSDRIDIKCSTEIKTHAQERTYWQDGVDTCSHADQIALPINQGEKQLYKCNMCGLITEGPVVPVMSLHQINEYKALLKDLPLVQMPDGQIMVNKNG